jgi:hypothetical protein
MVNSSEAAASHPLRDATLNDTCLVEKALDLIEVQLAVNRTVYAGFAV